MVVNIDCLPFSYAEGFRKMIRKEVLHRLFPCITLTGSVFNSITVNELGRKPG